MQMNLKIIITDNIKIGKTHMNYWFILSGDVEVSEYKDGLEI